MTCDQGLMLGFDAGSVAFKTVVTDRAGAVLETTYTRMHGRPIETALHVLGQLTERYGSGRFELVAGTGSAGRLLCQLLQVTPVNEVICQAVAARRLCPGARTLIEMGGQDSKLVVLPEPGTNGRPMLDFAINTNCAAGTGSFLDQQASRLGLSIEEFGRLALESRSVPRVAGRCSVFAKSDMIHLQQQGVSLPDIIAGLCLGLMRNLKSNLGRGLPLPRPLAFCGGVAANAGVVRAVCEVFQLAPDELVIPTHFACSGALGAVLACSHDRAHRGPRHGRPVDGVLDLAPLAAYLQEERTIGHRLAPLQPPAGTGVALLGVARTNHGSGLTTIPSSATVARNNGEPRDIEDPRRFEQCHTDAGAAAQPADPTARNDGEPRDMEAPRRFEQCHTDAAPVDAYLGVDVGSISTKAVVLDAENRLLAKTYLMTAGRPLEAVRTALQEIERQVGDRVRIVGAATTGSGRYLISDFIGADLVVNEITAQATAAAQLDPQVDTIFEIGGQDSKYIRLEGGVVVDFEMNHACAAGTGSFLEEQAERLGVDITQQFAPLALGSRQPIRLGERCTVFMEADLLSHQQQGASTEDLAAGLCYSVASNYLNRVVGRRSIGQRVFFQGGTAYNQAVVAAFARVLGREIVVPPHHEVTGAIGAAILARRQRDRDPGRAGRFGGFAVADLSAQVDSFECQACTNHCEINVVRVAERDPLYYGSRCDRYNVRQGSRPAEQLPDLFAERQALLLRYAELDRPPVSGRPTVGLPLALAHYHLLPLWGTLLARLGLNVVVSPVSTQPIIRSGVEAVLSTPCFPVKVAHGHVLDLARRGVDMIWLPSILDMPHDPNQDAPSRLCPYVMAIPYQVEAAFETQGVHVPVVKPPVRLSEGPRGLRRELRPFCRQWGVSAAQLRRAVRAAWQAQQAFEQACRDRGREVLEDLPPDGRAVVVVSRPYSGCDRGVSLDLPKKLRRLDVLPIPLDFLDLDRPEPSPDYVVRRMYWEYGQQVLRAAEVVRDDPRLHAIYLSNFSCGPDSFLIGYFKRLMAPKPALVLEVDEHSADAGLVTRLEAFLDSSASALPASPSPRRTLVPPTSSNGAPRKVFLPWMGDHSHAVVAAFRAHSMQAEVLPMASAESLEAGRRWCSGKECLPYLITTGDMILATERPDFDPHRTAFFMPCGIGPCRFGQYHCGQKLVLADLGWPEIPILSPSQDKGFYDQWRQTVGPTMPLAWCGFAAVDVLFKATLALRPYEVCRGQTDELYRVWTGSLFRLMETRPKFQQLVAHLRQAAAAFAEIATDRTSRRPRVGVVGEIYVRHHDFANQHLLRQLEALGAETTLASFCEWIFYLNANRKSDAQREWNVSQWLKNALQDRFKHRVLQRLSEPFEPLVGPLTEPPVAELLELADPYLHRTARGGDAIVSVGKAIELQRHGCHGVINVMPFSCMPSTIAAGIMKKLAADLAPMPLLSISYDGQQDPTLPTRLEAFLEQARACRNVSRSV